MWELALAIRHTGCPVSDTSARVPSVRLQNLSKTGQTGDVAKRLIALHGDPDDIERFAATFADHETTEAIELVSGAGAELQYFSTVVSYDPDNPAIVNLLDAYGCYQHNAVAVTGGIEHWIIYLEDEGAGSDIIAEIERYDNRVDLYRRVNLDNVSEGTALEYTALLGELTPRQRDAFRVALELGYYNQGTDVVIDDVAAALDLHRTTTWEHMKKAQNVILREVGHRLFPQANETPATRPLNRSD